MKFHRCSVPARIIFCLVLAFFCQLVDGASSRSVALAAGVEILTPRPDSTIVARNPETHLVLRQPRGRETVQAWVEVDGNRINPRLVMDSQGFNYLHFRLPLKPARNTFAIFPGGQRLVITYRPVRAKVNPNTLGSDVYLFHQSGQLPQSCAECHHLLQNATIERLGIVGQESCVVCHGNILERASAKHSTTVNRQCLTCHQQYTQPWRIGFPNVDIENICFSCHTSKKAWGSRKYVHGPLIAGGCTLCHNPHGDENRHQLWADGAADLCVACHSDKEGLVQKSGQVRFPHGIIYGPGCVACHDPHASDHEAMLHRSINELCVSCHHGLAGIRRGHPVGGHPVEGPSERRRPGRKLNCTSCHDPHGSSYRYMLFAEGRGGHVCSRCHR